MAVDMQTNGSASPPSLTRPVLPLAAECPSGKGRGISGNVFTLHQTSQLECLLTMLRDESTSKGDFIFYADRVTRLLVEEGLNCLPVKTKQVVTPTGAIYNGHAFSGNLRGISILRAGESMEGSLRSCARSAKIGKILIQRDEETCQAKLYYSKLPSDVAKRHCLLLDPMLATGASVIAAVRVILEHGVPERNIIFLNLLSSPEGLLKVTGVFPEITIITGKIDEGLNEVKYLTPGVGDFGDRYF